MQSISPHPLPCNFHFLNESGRRKGKYLQNSSIPKMPRLASPIRLRRFLRHGQALEGVWLDCPRHSAYAGDYAEGAALGEHAEGWWCHFGFFFVKEELGCVGGELLWSREEKLLVWLS
jgi:hypothetical protein